MRFALGYTRLKIDKTASTIASVWFWWGKKAGDDGYKKLWRMLFDRLVHFHKLTYFPGHDVVDILATDVYSEGFNQ